MQIRATIKYLRISPKKIRPIVTAVKKLRIAEALNFLEFNSNKGSSLIKDALNSALASAKKNYNLEKEDLIIKEISVDQGIAFKRWRAVSRGSAHAYKKRTSHLRLTLEQVKEVPKSYKKPASAQVASARQGRKQNGKKG